MLLVASLILSWFTSTQSFLGQTGLVRGATAPLGRDVHVSLRMESGSSMEVEGFNFFGDNSDLNDAEDGKDEESALFDARMSSTEYIPAIGLESIIYTLGTTRALFQCEYDLIFTRFPGIYATAIVGEWPKISKSILEDTSPDYELMDFSLDSEDDSIALSELEQGTLQLALTHHKERSARPRQDSDVEESLEVFRKTILGLDKYRINNPSRVASKYIDLLQATLDVVDGWMAGANALEYAGLTIRDHVVVEESKDVLDADKRNDNENPLENFREEEEGDDGGDKKEQLAAAVDIPILDISGLWTQAAVRLLDLEFTEKNVDIDIDKEKNDAISATFDQRFFQQIGIDDEGKLRIKDFMLYLLRICCRAVLSRPDTPYICVQMGNSPGEEQGNASAASKLWEPPISAVRNTLMLDFDMNRGSNTFDVKEGGGVRFVISLAKK